MNWINQLENSLRLLHERFRRFLFFGFFGTYNYFIAPITKPSTTGRPLTTHNPPTVLPISQQPPIPKPLGLPPTHLPPTIDDLTHRLNKTYRIFQNSFNPYTCNCYILCFFRSSRPDVLLKISQNLQENTCSRVSFLIKLQASSTSWIPDDASVCYN